MYVCSLHVSPPRWVKQPVLIPNPNCRLELNVSLEKFIHWIRRPERKDLGWKLTTVLPPQSYFQHAAPVYLWLLPNPLPMS